jgi:hypothetical protein
MASADGRARGLYCSRDCTTATPARIEPGGSLEQVQNHLEERLLLVDGAQERICLEDTLQRVPQQRLRQYHPHRPSVQSF